jgi:NADPH-dependent 2,4-dienoyl-CoA reductase/sulfur reductase-like enzyme
MGLSRRRIGRGFGGLGLAAATIGFPVPLRGQVKARVVVIGGGAGGATCARYLAKDSAGALAVTLVEEQPLYTTCFYSNLYLAGWRALDTLTHGYGGLEAAGVELVPMRAAAVDAAAKTVRLVNGESLAYDKLVVAPGIDLKYGSIEGYGEAAAEIMPHGWKAGGQTALLRSQLEAMPDGGLFVIVAPPEPYRCPPAPYERASLVAAYFARAKPRSKILILDAKDSFSKQALFEEAWSGHYKGMIEWVPGALGGKVVAVDTRAMALTTAAGDVHQADVANVVPAQEAGEIAHRAGLVDASGWCPIVPASMASRSEANIHVLGDAAIASAMPKSAFAANSQAKVVAMTIRSELTGAPAVPARYRNTCWSSLAPDDTVKIGATYRPGEAKIETIDSFVSNVGESSEMRRQTREEADAWYDRITTDIFG